MEETQTSAPEATPAPETQAKPEPASETKASRKENAVAELRKMLESKRAPAPAPAAPSAPAPAPTPAAEKTIEKIEASGGKAPDQKAGESDAQYELRLAKSFREQRQSAERAAKAEKAAETSSAENAKLKKLFESGKANPLSALKEMGWSFADVVKAINEDKIKEPEKGLELPPEIAEKLERLDRAEKAREEERLSAERETVFSRHVAEVDSFVKENVEDFPLVSSLPGAARAIVQEAREKGVSDITALLEGMESTLLGEMAPLFKSEAAMKSLLKAHPDMKTSLVKLLGLEAPAAPVPEASSIDQISTEPGTPGSAKSRSQLKAEALAELKRMRSGR